MTTSNVMPASRPKLQRLLLLGGLFLVSLFFHLYQLGYGELGNDETIIAAYTVRFLHGFSDPVLFGSLFIASHGPLLYLVNLPFLVTLGFSELIFRLPHALFGAGVVIPLFLIGDRFGNRRVAWLAGLLYAVSGINGLNRLAQGISIYLFFLLFALYFLLVYLETDQDRSLIWSSICLSVAIYTYIEAAICLPAILWLLLQAKGVRVLTRKPMLSAMAITGGAIALFIALWYGLPFLAAQWGYIRTAAGNGSHLLDRLTQMGAFNLGLMFQQYNASNSPFHTLLLLVGVIAGLVILPKHQTFQAISIFMAPHLLVWLFVFYVMAGPHLMFDLPLLVLLAALGLDAFLTRLATKPPRLRWAGYLTLWGCVVLSGWHVYVNFNQHALTPTPNHLVFSSGAYAAPTARLGSKAAGYYIRTHTTDVTQWVFTYGTGSAAFYAGRLDKDHQEIRKRLGNGSLRTRAELVAAIAQAADWPKVEYLIISQENQILWSYAKETYFLEAQVNVAQQPALYIFHCRTPADESKAPVIIAAEQAEALYNAAFGRWQDVEPWFLPMAQERL